MRRIFFVICLCVLALTLTGCKKARMRSQLKGLMESTISLPEKITCVENGETYPMPDSLRGRAKLIIYVDSTECTTCRINRLLGYQRIHFFSQTVGSFDLMILFPNIDLYGVPATRYVADLGIELPVYFDDENSFSALNSSVPQDSRMHSFLIDEDGTPLCVGDPVTSEKMFQFFLEAVKKLSDSIPYES